MNFVIKINLIIFFFSIKNLIFKGLDEFNSIFNEKTFITKDFPYHNSFSILSSNNFNIKNKTLEKYDYIKDIQNQLKAEIISTNIKEDLDTFFAPKYDLKKNEKKSILYIWPF